MKFTKSANFSLMLSPLVLATTQHQSHRSDMMYLYIVFRLGAPVQSIINALRAKMENYSDGSDNEKFKTFTEAPR